MARPPGPDTLHAVDVLPAPSMPGPLDALRAWSPRRWATAALGALGSFVVIGVPTDVIPNPWFDRPVDVTWWSVPVLVITAVLGGLLLATYVREPDAGHPRAELTDLDDRPARAGGIGGLLAFFAVGCPVCNKLVVVAIGTSGALSWFAPLQPVLAVASMALLAVALRTRLRNGTTCAVPA